MGALAVMAVLGTTAVVGWTRRVARAAAAARLAVAAPLALLLATSLIAPLWLLLSSIAFLVVAMMRRDYGTIPARWPAWLPKPPTEESSSR